MLTAVEDVLFIGLMAGLDVQMLALDGDSTRFGLAVPILELAAEWRALSWLHVRSAIKGGYGFQLAGPGDNMPKHEQMTFSSGLGFPLGPVAIDAVIQYSLWQDGPYFMGGNPGFFAGVSLAYQWGRGDEASAAERPEPAAAAPAAEKKPAAKPAAEKNAAAKPAPAKKEPAAGEPEKKPEPEFEGWD